MKKIIIFLSAQILLAVAVLHAQPPSPDGPPKPPNAAERLKFVSDKFEKELKLTAAQKNKLSAAYKDFFDSMEKLPRKEGKPPPPPPPPPPADKEAVEKLSKARDAQIKTVLNSEQYQKYIALEKTMRPPPPKGKPGEPPMPPPNERKE